jgi:hypothetical protein
VGRDEALDIVHALTRQDQNLLPRPFFPIPSALLGFPSFEPERKHIIGETEIGIGHLGELDGRGKWQHVAQCWHVELHVGDLLLERTLRNLFRGIQNPTVAPENKESAAPVVDAPGKLVPAIP